MQLMQLTIDVLVYPESRLYHGIYASIRSLEYCLSYNTQTTSTKLRLCIYTWFKSLESSFNVIMRVG